MRNVFDFEARWDAIRERENKALEEYNERKAKEPKPMSLSERLDNINESIKNSNK